MKPISIPGTWRKPQAAKPFVRNVPPYPATRFFDQLSFIGDENVCCFLLETGDGLVLLDCMDADQRCMDIIENGIRSLGHDPGELRAILITHGHGDHWGMSGSFREKYGCALFMGEQDYLDARELPDFLPWRLDYPMDGYLEDMHEYKYGETAIRTVLTPGHTRGCMSFLIPVTDEGEPHLLALWGGTSLIANSDPEAYKRSVAAFSALCRELGVDGEISNHPFFDSTIERLELVNSIAEGVPNPFIIGTENCVRYLQKYDRMADREIQKRAERAAAGLPPVEWVLPG